jgi:hypothetical protein
MLQRIRMTEHTGSSKSWRLNTPPIAPNDIGAFSRCAWILIIPVKEEVEGASQDSIIDWPGNTTTIDMLKEGIIAAYYVCPAQCITWIPKQECFVVWPMHVKERLNQTLHKIGWERFFCPMHRRHSLPHFPGAVAF